MQVEHQRDTLHSRLAIGVEEEQQDYSEYEDEDEDIEEYTEEEIIEKDETEDRETFEKIKKQDKSNVYDEY